MFEKTEFDVWTAPEDAVQALYPATQKLIERLRRRQWYYRAIAYLPVFGWGSLLVYALFVDGFGSGFVNWLDMGLIVVVLAFMVYTAWCLLAPGLWRRIIGYGLSALVALIGGLGSCLIGALLSFGAQMDGGPGPLVAALYFLGGVFGGFLSLLAMVHILLLAIVSVRLRALTGMQTLRAVVAARGEVGEELKSILARARPVAPSANPADPTVPFLASDPVDPGVAPLPAADSEKPLPPSKPLSSTDSDPPPPTSPPT